MQTIPASSLDLFCHAVRSMGDATICAVMGFSGRVDELRLRSAANSCLDAIPEMRSRLVCDGSTRWELQGRRNGDDAIPTIVLSDEDYHPFVADPMDPETTPQFRVRILRTPTRDVVVVSMAHAISDARGLKALATMLVEEYDHPGRAASGVSGLRPRDTTWTVERVHGALPAMRVVDPMWPRTWGTSNAPSTFHRVVLDEDETAALRSTARSQGGTVNDAILAAYALAMADLTGFSGTKDIFFPVDLRRHLPTNERIFSNQSANICFPMDLQEGMGMMEAFETVVENTRSMKDDGMGLREQAAMDGACNRAGDAIERMVSSMVRMQQDGQADVFVSNPGVLDLPELEGLEDAYLCYPGTYMPSFCFVASTFRGRMSVTVGYQDDDPSRSVTEEALRRFTANLREWT